MQKILIWDWPVRLGHGLLAIGFVLCWLTAESESWRLVHVVAGAVVLAVATFRLAWGFLGSPHARFTNFVRGPRAVMNYLRSLLQPHPEHHTGHNPPGGWAILALLGLSIATSLCGWLLYEDSAGEWLEELHEGLAATLLTVVVVHLAGVLSASLLHGENLVRAMLDGHKTGQPAQAITSSHPLIALLLLVWIVGLSWLVVT